MDAVGLRELRQDASGLLRRVENGEQILITVSGRPSARLVPARQARWAEWDAVADLFTGPGDTAWNDDRALLADTVRDPWEER